MTSDPDAEASVSRGRVARFSFELLADYQADAIGPMARGHAAAALVQQHLYRDVVQARSGGMYAHLVEVFPRGRFDGLSPWLNLLYFPRSRVIVCRIPKNATNSILYALICGEVPRLASILRPLLKVNREFGYEVLNRLSNAFAIPDLNLLSAPHIRKLAFVRQPLDRLASAIDNKLVETLAPPLRQRDPEPLVEELLRNESRRTGHPFGVGELSLARLAGILSGVDVGALDPHFVPQTAFAPSFDSFEVFSVDAVDAVLGDGRKSRRLNASSSRNRRPPAPGSTAISDRLAATPFAAWDEDCATEWKRGVLASRGMSLRPLFGAIYAADWELIERIGRRLQPAGSTGT